MNFRLLEEYNRQAPKTRWYWMFQLAVTHNIDHNGKFTINWHGPKMIGLHEQNESDFQEINMSLNNIPEMDIQKSIRTKCNVWLRFFNRIVVIQFWNFVANVPRLLKFVLGARKLGVDRSLDRHILGLCSVRVWRAENKQRLLCFQIITNYGTPSTIKIQNRYK